MIDYIDLFAELVSYKPKSVIRSAIIRGWACNVLKFRLLNG